MNGPVSEDEFDRLEDFFRSRETAAIISLCPLADASLIELIGKRGYRISHFENTLARTLSPESQLPDADPRVSVRQTRPDEGDVWTRTVMTGFSEGLTPPAESINLFMPFFDTPAGPSWIAEVEGRPVAGAAMGFTDRVAMLYGDATLPEARGQGAQAALIRARLLLALEKECDLAIACTLPGSVSQRNYERFGFRVAYTKALMIKEWTS
jgi:GNAT superfamily N-acetyltransferase